MTDTLTTDQAGPTIEPAAAVIGFAAWLTGRRDAVTIGASHDTAIVAELVETFRKSQGWAPPSDDLTAQLRDYPAEDPGREALPDPVVDAINALRSEIKKAAEGAKFLADITKKGETSARLGEDKGEIIANLMLTYRHLEDASMRLGKAIQARDGGVSVYDRATTVGA